MTWKQAGGRGIFARVGAAADLIISCMSAHRADGRRVFDDVDAFADTAKPNIVTKRTRVHCSKLTVLCWREEVEPMVP